MSARALYLGGEWLRTDTTLRVVNPASGETVAFIETKHVAIGL